MVGVLNPALILVIPAVSPRTVDVLILSPIVYRMGTPIVLIGLIAEWWIS